MGQILLSYWWIIVLVIIIIAIITRSLFKILILLVVASIFFVLFWQVFISSGFSESSECFTNEAIYMSESYDKYQQISSDEERKQAICEGDVESFQRLTDCLRTSNSHNGLSFLLYSKQPKFIKTISDTIENHNQTCPDSVLTSPIY